MKAGNPAANAGGDGWPAIMRGRQLGLWQQSTKVTRTTLRRQAQDEVKVVPYSQLEPPGMVATTAPNPNQSREPQRCLPGSDAVGALLRSPGESNLVEPIGWKRARRSRWIETRRDGDRLRGLAVGHSQARPGRAKTGADYRLKKFAIHWMSSSCKNRDRAGRERGGHDWLVLHMLSEGDW